MFGHKFFDVYSFETVPLNQDCYLIAENCLVEYEKSLLECFSGRPYSPVGYVAPVAPRKVNDDSIELSWYPNVYSRFHEVTVLLPKAHFIACVGSWRYDEKPRIFVDGAWLEQLYLKHYSVFCWIDVIDVKKALRRGDLSRGSLLRVRSRLDGVAATHPNVAFISFADNLLLKSNWSVGHLQNRVKYTYRPETLLCLIEKVRKIYQEELSLDIYAILTQGANEYYDDELLHIANNHVCLNSLGIPFAELLAIDTAVSDAIKAEVHPRADLYMDERFYHSLKFKHEKMDEIAKGKYRARMMSGEGVYYYAQSTDLLQRLDLNTEQ